MKCNLLLKMKNILSWFPNRLLHILTIGILFLLVTANVRAWNVVDQAGGTNYIFTGTPAETNYFSAYTVTNDTAVPFSNIWVRIGGFTNAGGSAKYFVGKRVAKKKDHREFGR